MRRALAPLALLAAALAGCGNQRAKPPTVTGVAPAYGFIPVSLPQQGLSFERPRQWRYAAGTPPLLATMTSGLVTIAVWRYPRSEPLPRTQAQLDAARDALVAAAKARDPSFRVIKAKGTRAAHQPAVVIVADETVAGQPRRVRSTHVYAVGAEYVVDAYAPPEQYAQVEDPIFRRVVRTLRVSRP